jgi:chromosome segregation protein
MHIKKLEICGFKSFVDRTVIHFDHDVIGIVGPNGCGKSNVVDAIRWCMGEMSAKHLRGKSMEDVIFNGSESRGPHGFAEVTLTFDNTDPVEASQLPPEYAEFPELAITRRLFRDGTSEYLINKTQVRLRDITDLFLGTGVGTKAYSIVEQGRIGQIVSARAEDRRLFIEEAAGITKYKKRRQQAERKMELTRQNLLRVSDIVTEIERTRDSLKRQAAKAERFVRYREELEELMLHQSTHTLLEMIVVERVEREALGSAGAKRAELESSLAREELALSAAKESAFSIEARSEQAAQASFRADNVVSTLMAELVRWRDQLTHLDGRLRAADEEARDLGYRREQLEGERGELENRLASLGEDARARETDAAAEEEQLSTLREEEARANGEVATLKERIAEGWSKRAALQAQLNAIAQRIGDGRARQDRLTQERDALAGEVSELRAHETALRRSVAEWAEGKRLSAAELEALDLELAQLRPRALEAERKLDAAKNDLGLKRNRLRALEDLHRRYEGVGAGVRALLSADHPTVLGLVADRIEAPEELTPALAGLLGDRLQCVIVEDPARGLELLDELRSAGRGRATVTSARPRFVAGAARRSPAGTIGFLIDHLRYAAEDEPLVRTLVGDAVVCENAQHALDVVHASPGTIAVAVDGTVVDEHGFISGGSSDDVASAMMEHKREMRVLGGEVDKLEQQVASLAEEHRVIRVRMADVGTSLDRAREGAHENEIAHVSAEKDLTRTESEIERISRRCRSIDNELEELDAAVATLLSEESNSARELDDVQRQLEHLGHAISRAEESATSWKDRVSSRAELVTERMVRLAQVKEQVDAVNGALDRVRHAAAEVGERADRLRLDSNEAARAFGETAANIVLGRERRAAAEVEARVAHEEQSEARHLLDQVRGVLGEKEAELKALRTDLHAAEETSRAHELSLQKLELEREHLLRNVRERFRGLDLHRVVGKYHARPAPDEEHNRRIDELTRLIERMGPVNLDAQNEFEEAERRYVDLSSQKDDIEKALLDLERAIKHMNRESRRRFKETFDSVNELFRATFTRMFRGGRAELILTDPENLLESGVDIVAQPPGKRLGNIELMSGGEKALTATSLIFAIFQHKPSPFCVLDEVDAPLDDANVARYNEMIRAMTDRSQFILITHIKATMQVVDVLYGVTMGEPGVSRTVNVKVNDDAKRRSERHAGVLDAPPRATPMPESGSEPNASPAVA